MTLPVLIFAPFVDSDAALWNSRWVARETATAISNSHVLEGAAAVRNNLESQLAANSYIGLVLTGHGDAAAAYGTDDEKAIDETNLSCVCTEWLHLLACHVGSNLAVSGRAHSTFIVGYRGAVIVEFTVEDLPRELLGRLKTLLLSATLALLSGIRSRQELQRQISTAADSVVAWLLENTEDGDYLGLHCLTETLVERIITNR